MFQADDGDEVATERMLLKSIVMNSVWRVKKFQLQCGLFYVLDSILFCGMDFRRCFLNSPADKDRLFPQSSSVQNVQYISYSPEALNLKNSFMKQWS